VQLGDGNSFSLIARYYDKFANNVV